MVSSLAIAQGNAVIDVFLALGSALSSVFGSDDSDRSLLDEIVKHWLTILVEETSVGRETVR